MAVPRHGDFFGHLSFKLSGCDGSQGKKNIMRRLSFDTSHRRNECTIPSLFPLNVRVVDLNGAGWSAWYCNQIFR